MFKRKAGLTAWILSAAVAFSMMTVPVSAAGVLPSVGAGATLSVSSVSEVASAVEAKTVDTAKLSAVDASSILPSAGVEAAASITSAPKTAVKETAAVQSVKAAAPAAVSEIVTDEQPVAVQTAAPAASESAGINLLATLQRAWKR